MKAKELIKNEVQEPLIGDGKQTIDEWAIQYVEACYEPSSDFDRDCMIQCVKAGFEAYKNNSSVFIPQKTLQECKDEVARNRGYKEWGQLFTACGNEALQKRMDEAAELYASQQRVRGWTSVKEKLPDKNGYYIAMCIHPYKEPGLIHYHKNTGWQNGFYECTHWMPLPSTPTDHDGE